MTPLLYPKSPIRILWSVLPPRAVPLLPVTRSPAMTVTLLCAVASAAIADSLSLFFCHSNFIDVILWYFP